MIIMKAKLYDLEGKETGEVELPAVFSTPFRPDVIKRAVLAQQSAKRQPYGTDPLAGLRSSAHYHGSRHYRFKMMNMEMSRIPRIHGKVGYMAWRARVAPHAVKGRRAHPPKASKIWLQKINDRERLLAIRSAIAASKPVIFVDDFENMKNTKSVLALLSKVMPYQLERAAKKKVRAGRGKMRGRRYDKKKGPLVLLSKPCPAIRATRNVPGVDAVPLSNVNAELLAPGTHAGRTLITTKSALNAMKNKFGEERKEAA